MKVTDIVTDDSIPSDEELHIVMDIFDGKIIKEKYNKRFKLIAILSGLVGFILLVILALSESVITRFDINRKYIAIGAQVVIGAGTFALGSTLIIPSFPNE